MIDWEVAQAITGLKLSMDCYIWESNTEGYK